MSGCYHSETPSIMGLYIGILEKKMETTTIITLRDYIGWMTVYVETL